MQEDELDKQFEEMEQDTQVKAADAAVTQAQPKKKRITVAELNKAIDDIQNVKLPETLNWIGELDIRLETLETTTATHNKTLLGDVKTRLDILDQGSLSDRADMAADIAARLDNQDAAIGALANALRSHIEDSAAMPPTPVAEPEFAQPPEQMAGRTIDITGIAATASVCQTMTDVLMITRVLKEIPELTDPQRIGILNLACVSSSVILTPGLRIRAGVRNVEA